MKDLFDSRTLQDDPVFTRLREEEQFAKIRRQMNLLYNDQFKPYADRDFELEIRKSPLSRFWEMRLGCLLIDMGFKLTPRRDRPRRGPDFLIADGKKNVWIEAVCPAIGNGLGVDTAGKTLSSAIVEPVPTEQIVLRFSSVISEKAKKCDAYVRDGIVAETDPFVIALSGGAMPYHFWESGSMDEIPYAIQAVLPFGNPTITFNPRTKEVIGEAFQHRASIKKPSGNTVRTDTFLDDSLHQISALLFANTHPIYNRELHVNQVSLLHNASCPNLLPQRWREFGIQWDYVQKEGKLILNRVAHG